MDVLYTIKYKVGADTELSAHRDQLYLYAQKAFDVTPEQHRRYMAIVHEEKVMFCSFPYNFMITFKRYNLMFAMKTLIATGSRLPSLNILSSMKSLSEKKNL